jgi:hypothetical protein
VTPEQATSVDAEYEIMTPEEVAQFVQELQRRLSKLTEDERVRDRLVKELISSVSTKKV